MERFSRYVTFNGGVLTKNGTVQVYLAGTTVLATVFSDAAGTSPLIQPFPINPQTGEVAFYAGNGLYDVIISPSNGSPLVMDSVSLVDANDFNKTQFGLMEDFEDYNLKGTNKGWHGWWDADGHIHFETKAGSGADIFFHPDGGTVHLNTSLDVSGNGQIHATGRINSNYDPVDTIPSLWLSSNTTPSNHKDYILVNPPSGVEFDHFLHFVKTDGTDAVMIDKDGRFQLNGFLDILDLTNSGGTWNPDTNVDWVTGNNGMVIRRVIDTSRRGDGTFSAQTQIPVGADGATYQWSQSIYGFISTEQDSDGGYLSGVWGDALAVLPAGRTIGSLTGIGGWAGVYSGTVTNLMGAEVSAEVQGGAATNAIGLHVVDITGAINNYAIKTGLGKVQFGDVVLGVDGNAAAPGYAFASDPSYGMFYRSGSPTGIYWSLNGTDVLGISTNMGLRLRGTYPLSWTNNGQATGGVDLTLYRDAAGVLALRNGTYAQTFRIYNTYTDASNYSRLNIGDNGSNGFILKTEKAGTGSTSPLQLVGSGTLDLGAGSGTKWQMQTSGHFVALVDNSYDIGSSGNYRPRYIYVAGSVTVPATYSSNGWFGSGNSARVAFTGDGGATYDAALSRTAAGAVAVGNGTAGDASGTISAAIHLAGDGSAATPSYGFTSSTGWGMYIVPASGMFFQVAQNNPFFLNSVGAYAKRFGIGASANAPDVFLERDNSGTLALRNGVSPQTLRLYNTYTDASNYERAVFWWGSNVFAVGTEGAGTGVQRDISFRGNNIILRPSGVDRWQVSATGHFLASTDNQVDIGASGANRPRNGYFGGTLNAGSDITSGHDLIVGAAAGMVKWWGGSAYDVSISRNSANTLQFGDGGTNANANLLASQFVNTSDAARLGSSGVKIGSGTVFGISSTAASSGTTDTGLSRGANPGWVCVGNGTAGDQSGTLYAACVGVGTGNLYVNSHLIVSSAAGVLKYYSGSAYDVSLSRVAAGTLQVGDGGQNANGSLKAATLQVADGTYTTPSVQFSDANVGFYEWGNGIGWKMAGYDAGYLGSSTIGVRSNMVFAWHSGNPQGTSTDVGISRGGAGVVYIGNGTAGDKTGSIQGNNAWFNNLFMQNNSVLEWGTDTGISRKSAGMIAVGNGGSGDTTGGILVGDGSAAAPTFAFGSETGTGFYKAASGDIRFVAAATEKARFNGAGVFSTGALGIGASTVNIDVWLLRDAANILALRNGTNAQAFRIYNTYTDSANNERAQLSWSGNAFYIGTAGVGTGVQRQMVFDCGTQMSFAIGGVWRLGLTTNMLGMTSGSNDATVDLGASWGRFKNVYAVKYYGDGSALTGITGATGGVSNTGSTTIEAGSDLTTDKTIALKNAGANVLAVNATSIAAYQQFEAMDGNNGTAGISFASAPTNTGLYYSSGAAGVAVTVSGTSRALASGSGLSVHNAGRFGWSSAASADGASMDTGLIRVSAGFVGVGNGTMADNSGGILVGDGSASAPTYSFGAQTGTGMYRPGANQLGFTINGTDYLRLFTSGTVLPSSSYLGWTAGGVGGTVDTILMRDTANVLALRNGGTAASPVPQSLRLYNFITDASNYERATLGYVSGGFVIDSSGAGTGTVRNIVFAVGGSWKWYVLGNSGAFTPTNDNVVDVGTVGSRVKSVYAVKYYGDGSALTGITGATGGISNTGSTTIEAGSDLTTDKTIALKNAGVNVMAVNAANITAYQPFFTPDGTAAAPSYSFTSAPGTGLYRLGNNIQFSSAGVAKMAIGPSDISLGAAIPLGWSGNIAGVNADDLYIWRDAANTLAQRNGTNPQSFRLYNTYTDGSNYERLNFYAAGTTGYILVAEAAGTGVKRNIIFDGSQLTFKSGGVNRWVVDANGHFLASSDNTFDIGGSGAKPRNIYATTDVVAGNALSGKAVTLAQTTTGSGMNAINITNAAETQSYYYPYISLSRQRGTISSPLTVQAGDIAGGVNFYAYNGTANEGVAGFWSIVSGLSGSNHPIGQLSFSVNDGTTAGSNFTAFTCTPTQTTFNTPVLHPDGTKTAPAFAFSGASNTGWYRYPGTTSAVLSVNGNPCFTITPSQSARIPSTYSFGWSSTSDATVGPDVALSRTAAGAVAVGNGTAGDTSGTLVCAKLTLNGVDYTTISGGAGYTNLFQNSNILEQRNGTNYQEYKVFGSYTDATHNSYVSTRSNGSNFFITAETVGNVQSGAYFSIGTGSGNTGYLQFMTGGSTRWFINTGGDLKPQSDATYAIGSSSARVSTVYANNVIASNLSNTVAKAQLTGQTAAIGNTTLFTATATGTYRVSRVGFPQVVGTGSVTMNIAWNNGYAALSSGGTIDMTSLGSNANYVAIIHLASGQSLTYSTSGTFTGTYGMDIIVEQIG